MAKTSAFLKLDGSSMRYGGVFVLNAVHFEASKGLIHAICERMVPENPP